LWSNYKQRRQIDHHRRQIHSFLMIDDSASLGGQLLEAIRGHLGSPPAPAMSDELIQARITQEVAGRMEGLRQAWAEELANVKKSIPVGLIIDHSQIRGLMEQLNRLGQSLQVTVKELPEMIRTTLSETARALQATTDHDARAADEQASQPQELGSPAAVSGEISLAPPPVATPGSTPVPTPRPVAAQPPPPPAPKKASPTKVAPPARRRP
jgi:hypothetical protein